ncbi:MAG: filamentous hemagglutinin N-terminal domain-containing protein [Planctomycetota bacterium]|nr:filamentous hemagglutinin N-terminal domain-containing protein [Planctomycetota bacterium]
MSSIGQGNCGRRRGVSGVRSAREWAMPSAARLSRFAGRVPLALGLLGGWGGWSAALAGPEGAEVVHGDVSIQRTGDLTQIHAGHNAIINYKSFNIGAHETVQFVQPDVASRVLNRISSVEPTRIDGALLANGRVYLVNPAGVYFGAGSVVNVGAIYAAAAHMSNADFLAGIDRFTDVKGAVVNEGRMTGDLVALIGQTVANRGSIDVPAGTVMMVAGDEVYVGERNGKIFAKVSTNEGGVKPGAGVAGVDNAGSINAKRTVLGAGDLYSLAIRTTGSIKAADVEIEGRGSGRVEVAGTIDARGGAGQRGGDVKILGEQIELRSAKIDASGPAGGGTVLVGGNWQGKGPERNASTTSVSRDSTIKADAAGPGGTGAGDGGTVVVWSDDATRFAGRVSVRGGSEGGDGGQVEVSGKDRLAYSGFVDALAPKGKVGDLLLDPTNITVIAGAGTLTLAGSDQFGDPDVGANTLQASLIENAAANVTLQAQNNITFDAPITMANDGVGIAAQAGNNITVNQSITTRGGNVTFTANDVGGTETGTGGIFINAAIDTNSGGGGAGAITLNVPTGTGRVTLNANLTSRNQAINFNAPLTVTGTRTVNSGTGTITLNATSIASGQGLVLRAREATLNAAIGGGGDLTLIPDADGTPIAIGGSDPGAGTLHISTDELARIDGLNSTVVGLGTLTGGITIDDATIADPLTLVQGTGTIDFSGDVTINASTTLSLFARGIDIGGSASIAGSGTLSLDADLVGTPIAIRSGGPGTSLNLSAAELSRISVATWSIGGTGRTGNLSIEVPITIDQAVSLLSGTGTITVDDAVTVSPGDSLFLRAREIELNAALSGGGNLLLFQDVAATPIQIGDTDPGAGTLHLSAAELGEISNLVVTVGLSDGTGGLTFAEAVTVDDPFGFYAGTATLAVNEELTVSSNVRLEGREVTIGAGILGGGVLTIAPDLVAGAVAVGGSDPGATTLHLSQAELDLITGPSRLEIGREDGTGTTTVNDVTSLETAVRFVGASTGSVQLAGTLTSSNNDVEFNSPLTLTGTRLVDAGTGTITINAAARISGSGDTLDLRANEIDISSTGSIGNGGGAGGQLVLRPGADRPIVLGGGTTDSGTLDIVAAELGRVSGLNLVTVGLGGLTQGVTLTGGTVGSPLVLSGSYAIDAGTGTVSTSGVVSTASNLSIEAGEIDLAGTFTGGGTLALRPAEANIPIQLGGTDPGAGTLHFAQAELDVVSGMSSYTIGRSDSTAAFNVVASVNFSDNVTLETDTGIIDLAGSLTSGGNNITVAGPLTLDDQRGVNAGAGAITLNNGATITGASGRLDLVAGEVDILAAIGGGGQLTINSNVASTSIVLGGTPGSGQLDLTAAELLLIDGLSLATVGSSTLQNASVAGAIVLNDTFVLDAAATTILGNITTNGNDITFNGPITILGVHAFNAGTGTITTNGTVAIPDTRALTLQAREIQIGAAINGGVDPTGGDLTLIPDAGSTAIVVGGSATNAASLDLSELEIGRIDGLRSTTIGSVGQAANISLSGPVTFNDLFTVVGGTGTITTTGTTTIASGALLVLEAPEIDLGGTITGAGQLVLQPIDATQLISLGGTDPGAATLHFGAAELGVVDGLTGGYIIGRSNGSGAITVNSVNTLRSSMTLRADTGVVSLEGDLSNAVPSTANSITFSAEVDVQGAGVTRLVNAGAGTITLSRLVTVDAPSALTYQAREVEINALSGPPAPTITGGGQLTILGDVAGTSIVLSGTASAGALDLSNAELGRIDGLSLLTLGSSATNIVQVAGATTLQDSTTIAGQLVETLTTGTINTNTQTLIIEGNEVNLAAAINGGGTLTIRPFAGATPIQLGGTDPGAGTLHLGAAELSLVNGLTLLTIGRSDSTTLEVASNVEVFDPLTIVGASGGLLTINGNITTNNNAFVLDVPYQVSSDAELNAGTANIEIRRAGSIDSARTLTLTADSLDLQANVAGEGSAVVRPASTTRNVDVRVTDPGAALWLTPTEVGRFQSTLSSLTIGRNTSGFSGLLTVDLVSDPLAFQPRNISLLSSGGTIVVSSLISVPDSVGGGLLRIESAGNVSVRASLTASTLEMLAGTDGTGNLEFAALSLAIRAESIQLRAGDDQTGTGGSTSAIELRNFEPNFRRRIVDERPGVFLYRQDAAITDAVLPTDTQFAGSVSGMDYTIQSDAGNIDLLAGSEAKFDASRLTLSTFSTNQSNITASLFGARALERFISNGRLVLNADLQIEAGGRGATFNGQTVLGTEPPSGVPASIQIVALDQASDITEPINFNGAVTVNTNATLWTGAASAADSRAIVLDQAFAVASGNTLTIRADEIDITSTGLVNGPGAVAFLPHTAGLGIEIGERGGDTRLELDFTLAELDQLRAATTPLSSITFGEFVTTGSIVVGDPDVLAFSTLEFADPVVFQTANTSGVRVVDPVLGSDNASLDFLAPLTTFGEATLGSLPDLSVASDTQYVYVSGNALMLVNTLVSAGSDVAFDGLVTLGADVRDLTLTVAAGREIELGGTVASANGARRADVIFRPNSASSSFVMALGSAADIPLQLDLEAVELARLDTSLTSVTFGSSTFNGTLRVAQDVTLQSDALFQVASLGTIDVLGDVTGDDSDANTTESLDFSGRTLLAGDLRTAGSTIRLRDGLVTLSGVDPVLGPVVRVDTTSGGSTGATITLASGVVSDSDGFQSLVLNAGSVGDIDLQGDLGGASGAGSTLRRFVVESANNVTTRAIRAQELTQLEGFGVADYGAIFLSEASDAGGVRTGRVIVTGNSFIFDEGVTTTATTDGFGSFSATFRGQTGDQVGLRVDTVALSLAGGFQAIASNANALFTLGTGIDTGVGNLAPAASGTEDVLVNSVVRVASDSTINALQQTIDFRRSVILLNDRSLTATADEVELGGDVVASGGTGVASLTIQPFTTTLNVDLGAAADAGATGLHLSQAELDRVVASDGTNPGVRLTIGRTDSTGLMTIGGNSSPVTFLANETTFRSGANAGATTIFVVEDVVAGANSGLSFRSSGLVDLRANVIGSDTRFVDLRSNAVVGRADVTIRAGSISVNQGEGTPATTTLAIGDNLLRLEAAEIDLASADGVRLVGTPGVSAAGRLLLRPLTDGAAINVGSVAGGDALSLDLAQSDLAAIQPGLALVTIGREGSGTHAIQIGTTTLVNATEFLAPLAGGSITIDGELIAENDPTQNPRANILFDAATGGVLWLQNAAVRTVGGTVTVRGFSTLGASSNIRVETTRGAGGPAGAAITFEGDINPLAAGDGRLTLDAGSAGLVTLQDTGDLLRLGELSIVNAGDVNAGGVTVVTLGQTAGSGTSTFGAIDANDVSLSGNNFVLSRGIVTTPTVDAILLGDVRISHAGSLAMTLLSGAYDVSGLFATSSLAPAALAEIGSSIEAGAIELDSRTLVTGPIELRAASLSAGGVQRYASQIDLNAGVDAGANALTLTADELNIGMDPGELLAGSANLVVQPFDSSTDINFGGSTGDVLGVLDITSNELAFFSDGAAPAWSLLSVGRTDGTGQISLLGMPYDGAVEFRGLQGSGGGVLFVDDDVTAVNDLTFNLSVDFRGRNKPGDRTLIVTTGEAGSLPSGQINTIAFLGDVTTNRAAGADTPLTSITITTHELDLGTSSQPILWTGNGSATLALRPADTSRAIEVGAATDADGPNAVFNLTQFELGGIDEFATLTLGRDDASAGITVLGDAGSALTFRNTTRFVGLGAHNVTRAIAMEDAGEGFEFLLPVTNLGGNVTTRGGSIVFNSTALALGDRVVRVGGGIAVDSTNTNETPAGGDILFGVRLDSDGVAGRTLTITGGALGDVRISEVSSAPGAVKLGSLDVQGESILLQRSGASSTTLDLADAVLFRSPVLLGVDTTISASSVVSFDTIDSTGGDSRSLTIEASSGSAQGSIGAAGRLRDLVIRPLTGSNDSIFILGASGVFVRQATFDSAISVGTDLAVDGQDAGGVLGNVSFLRTVRSVSGGTRFQLNVAGHNVEFRERVGDDAASTSRQLDLANLVVNARGALSLRSVSTSGRQAFGSFSAVAPDQTLAAVDGITLDGDLLALGDGSILLSNELILAGNSSVQVQNFDRSGVAGSVTFGDDVRSADDASNRSLRVAGRTVTLRGDVGQSTTGGVATNFRLSTLTVGGSSLRLEGDADVIRTTGNQEFILTGSMIATGPLSLLSGSGSTITLDAGTFSSGALTVDATTFSAEGNQFTVNGATLVRNASATLASNVSTLNGNATFQRGLEARGAELSVQGNMLVDGGAAGLASGETNIGGNATFQGGLTSSGTQLSIGGNTLVNAGAATINNLDSSLDGNATFNLGLSVSGQNFSIAGVTQVSGGPARLASSSSSLGGSATFNQGLATRGDALIVTGPLTVTGAATIDSVTASLQSSATFNNVLVSTSRVLNVRGALLAREAAALGAPGGQNDITLESNATFNSGVQVAGNAFTVLGRIDVSGGEAIFTGATTSLRGANNFAGGLTSSGGAFVADEVLSVSGGLATLGASSTTLNAGGEFALGLKTSGNTLVITGPTNVNAGVADLATRTITLNGNATFAEGLITQGDALTVNGVTSVAGGAATIRHASTTLNGNATFASGLETSGSTLRAQGTLDVLAGEARLTHNDTVISGDATFAQGVLTSGDSLTARGATTVNGGRATLSSNSTTLEGLATFNQGLSVSGASFVVGLSSSPASSTILLVSGGDASMASENALVNGRAVFLDGLTMTGAGVSRLRGTGDVVARGQTLFQEGARRELTSDARVVLSNPDDASQAPTNFVGVDADTFIRGATGVVIGRFGSTSAARGAMTVEAGAGQVVSFTGGSDRAALGGATLGEIGSLTVNVASLPSSVPTVPPTSGIISLGSAQANAGGGTGVAGTELRTASGVTLNARTIRVDGDSIVQASTGAILILGNVTGGPNTLTLGVTSPEAVGAAGDTPAIAPVVIAGNVDFAGDLFFAPIGDGTSVPATATIIIGPAFEAGVRSGIVTSLSGLSGEQLGMLRQVLDAGGTGVQQAGSLTRSSLLMRARAIEMNNHKLLGIGDLSIQATQNATVGDLSVLGDLSITAGGEILLRRRASASRLNVDTNNSVQTRLDAGPDLLANNIRITGAVRVLGSGGVPRAAAQQIADALANAGFELNALEGDLLFSQLTDFRLPAGFRSGGLATGTPLFFLPLDLDVDSVQQSVATAIAGAVPRDTELPVAAQDLELSEADRTALRTLGLNVRDPRGTTSGQDIESRKNAEAREQYVNAVTGRSAVIMQDVPKPGEGLWVYASRFVPTRVRGVLDQYVPMLSQAAEIRTSIDESVIRFAEAKQLEEIARVEDYFEWARTDADSAQAVQSIESLRRVASGLETIGLTAQEAAQTKRMLVGNFSSEVLTPDQLRELILNEKAPPASEETASVGAADANAKRRIALRKIALR